MNAVAARMVMVAHARPAPAKLRGMAMFEVELKFAAPDRVALERRLKEAGAIYRETRRQEDRYFSHPSRDFGKTDEALRLRRDGDRHVITYKGPKVDPQSKTRKEIEIGYDGGNHASARFAELLEALGFRLLHHVGKSRAIHELARNGFNVQVGVDQVDGLGVFVELEIQADDVSAARETLLALAHELDLKDSERRSYLELLLGSAPS